MSQHNPPEQQPTRRQQPAHPEPGERGPADQPTRRTARPDFGAEAGEPGGPPAPPDIPAAPPPASSRAPARRSRQDSGLYIPWWGFVIVILAVAAITCGMWWAVLSSRGDSPVSLGPSPTPLFVLITSSPTLGTGDETAATVTPSPTETPTLAPPTETPDPDALPIQVGNQIIIEGTEGSGLAVRQGPGVNFTYFFVANDGDTFLVEDGPRTGDGYVWWYISDPDDDDRSGWAVEDFMTVVQP